MGLDITLHRKGTPWGADYYYNGRCAYREVVEFMKNTYHYPSGMDYPLSFTICEQLKQVIGHTILENIDNNMKTTKLKAMFYDLTNIQIDIDNNNTNWYFEATW